MVENEETLLVPNEDYLKAGIHIGTKFKTKYMENFIYKTRQDGLNVLNIETIDQRIRILASFLSQYEPEDILILSRRENGWTLGYGHSREFHEEALLSSFQFPLKTPRSNKEEGSLS